MIDWLLKHSNFLKLIVEKIKNEINEARIGFNSLITKTDRQDNELREIRERLIKLETLIGSVNVHKGSSEEARTPQELTERTNRLIDKVMIISEIRALTEQGLHTSEIYNEIVIKKRLCRKTAFYKYFKLVRGKLEHTSQQTLRT